MHTCLYVIWFLLPIFFFGIALWSKLERYGSNPPYENIGDYVRQGVFVLACVVLSVLIDQYILEDIVNLLSPTWIPLGLYQVLLLPIVLLVSAVILGPSKAISIKSHYKQPVKPGKN